MEGLKCYFDVTNQYVFNKMKIIIFPFMLKEEQWKRGQSTTEAAFSNAENEEERFLPRCDVQAPDLYIPLMSFVTFILITGFAMG